MAIPQRQSFMSCIHISHDKTNRDLKSVTKVISTNKSLVSTGDLAVSRLFEERMGSRYNSYMRVVLVFKFNDGI